MEVWILQVISCLKHHGHENNHSIDCLPLVTGLAATLLQATSVTCAVPGFMSEMPKMPKYSQATLHLFIYCRKQAQYVRRSRSELTVHSCGPRILREFA